MKYFFYILFFLQLNASSQSCNYWSTYLGKTGSDDLKGIAIDNNKYSYVIMQTDSPSLTVTPGLISNAINGINDAYLAKFDSCGNFIWGTYLGTTGFESGEKIIICPDGNIAFTGYSYGIGLPTTAACFQPTNAGQSDCILGKISPTGTLLWLTYFGKSGFDFAYDLSCDFNGNIFIGGTTTSVNLYTNTSSFQQIFGGNTDAFVAKFSKDGILKWCTYYGGLGVEDIHALSTDVFGNIFGTGGTGSFNLSTSVGCIQPSLDALKDCYIIKLDSLGNRIFSSYLGGVGQDDAFGIATDASGNLYLSAETSSPNFTTTLSAYQPTLAGLSDMFFAKISPSGNLSYSTFIGGLDNDAANRMKIFNNQLYILGTTESSSFPMIGASTYSALPGLQNLVIIRFSASGLPNYSTFYGSQAGYDFGNDLAVTNNHLFFCGKSSSSTYPVTSNAFQPIYGFNDDGILTKLPNAITGIVTSADAKQLYTEEIILFPNPTAGKLGISGANLNGSKYEVLNFLGQLVKVVELINSEINVEDLSEGIYFLRINSSIHKFIKVN